MIRFLSLVALVFLNLSLNVQAENRATPSLYLTSFVSKDDQSWPNSHKYRLIHTRFFMEKQRVLVVASMMLSVRTESKGSLINTRLIFNSIQERNQI